MIYYILIFSFSLLCSFCVYEKNLSIINNKLLALFFCGFLIMLAGFRYNISSDYWSYYSLFYSNIEETRLEYLFKQLMLFCKNTFYSYNSLVFFVAFISITAKGFYFTKLNNPFLAILIYICIYFFDSDFNGIRQGLGIGFAFFAIEYGRKKKFICYVVFILLAAAFHSSYLVLLPFYFFCNKTINVKFSSFIFLMLILFAVRITVLNSILRYLQSILVASGNGIIFQLSQYLGLGEFSINLAILRRLFFIIVYLLIFGSKKLDIDFILYFMSFIICFMLSGNEIFAHRLSGVFDIFCIPLFSRKRIPFTKKNMILLGCFMASLTVLYFGNPMKEVLPYQSY